MAAPNCPWPPEMFEGDTRRARDLLGQRFVEHVAKSSWDEAAAMIDGLEANLLFMQETEQERANVRRFFAAFRAEWVTRQ